MNDFTNAAEAAERGHPNHDTHSAIAALPPSSQEDAFGHLAPGLRQSNAESDNSAKADEGCHSSFDLLPSSASFDNSPQGASGQACVVNHQKNVAGTNEAESLADALPSYPRSPLPESGASNHPPMAAEERPHPRRYPGSERTSSSNPEREEVDQAAYDTHRSPVDLRFSDPLIGEIVQLHRMRRRWIKARNALVLQCKAFGRSLYAGDKVEGTKAYERVAAGSGEERDEVLSMALLPFLPAIERFDLELHPIELRLAKLAKKLPVAPWANEVRGFGFGSLAAIVGEAGDLSQYHSVSAVWKRLGLAVIDGDGRQRKVANAEGALIHGYSPERRAVVWNVADSMSKHQRTWLDKETGEVKKEPGPYGVILEAEKAKALAAGCTKMHAENRAKRHMSKALLRDLYLHWRSL